MGQVSGELQEFDGRSIVEHERHSNSGRGLVRFDQNLSTLERFVQIVDHECNVRHGPDDLGHVALWLEPNPLDAVGAGLETTNVNPEVADVTLASTRLRVGNADVVILPAEPRGHGRRLMGQSLFCHAAASLLPVPLLDLEDDFPDHFAGLEHPVSFAGLMKRDAGTDDRFHPALGQKRPDLPLEGEGDGALFPG